MRVLIERDVRGVPMLCALGDGAPFARMHQGNLLSEGADGVISASGDLPVVAWSGTPADELFERDPRSFGAGAWERFGGVCDALVERGGRMIFRPHARHVLSDVQRIVKFMADRPRERFGVALDAAALLEESMLPKAADHFRRAFETLGPVADFVWLSGASGPAGEGLPLRQVALGEGVVGAEVVARLWREHCPPETPVVLAGESIEGQVALLREG